jgi:hypothetical protein
MDKPKKLSPKKVRICPGCPTNELSLDITPQFKFVNNINNDTKKINIFNYTKEKVKNKITSLF